MINRKWGADSPSGLWKPLPRTPPPPPPPPRPPTQFERQLDDIVSGIGSLLLTAAIIGVILYMMSGMDFSIPVRIVN